MNALVERISEADAARLEAQPWVEVRPGKRVRFIDIGTLRVRQVQQSCQDCEQKWPAHFSLTPCLWRELGLDGFICLSCVEKRLGRAVTREDLIPPEKATNNEFLFRGPLEDQP